jgi:hypothetical protein
VYTILKFEGEERDSMVYIGNLESEGIRRGAEKG